MVGPAEKPQQRAGHVGLARDEGDGHGLDLVLVGLVRAAARLLRVHHEVLAPRRCRLRRLVELRTAEGEQGQPWRDGRGRGASDQKTIFSN